MSSFGLIAMVHERAPLQMEQVPDLFVSWVQDAGGFAAAGLAIWLIAFLVRRPPYWSTTKHPLWLRGVFALLICLTGGAYLIHAAAKGVDSRTAAGSALGPNPFLTIGGAAALLAVMLPIALELGRYRWRRILAIADLSFWEAVRSKVLWVFSFLILIFLFADWFLPHKPENQLRTYVQVMYWAMTPLLLVPAGILAAFGIPRDLRQQTIFTVVTKPVERFEIVLGRFLGYVGLMTVVLLGMTALSLLFIVGHGVHPDAVQQTYRARVPIYGSLDFRGRSQDGAGVQMREWQYRRYISGDPASSARAVWTFTDLPSRLNERASVPVEFKFEIVRMAKGEEGRGVFCTLTFETWRWSPLRKTDYDRELTQQVAEERQKPQPASREEIQERLARKYGYFEHPSREVFDQFTYAVDVPVSLFQNALADYDRVKQEYEKRGQPPPAPLVITVKCESPKQFVGMAKYDLYLIDEERPFNFNFFKGALGLWFQLCLVIGVAVALSTYLSGVISLMTVLFLYGAGMLHDYIQSVATNQSVGGGPAIASYRMATGQNLTAPLENKPITQTAEALDQVFRWFLRQLMNLFPDVDRFDLVAYVAEGFDISAATLALNLLLLTGYLLPWAILGYYALKSREVAS